MSAEHKLHRGHIALLGIVRDGAERTAYERGGMVQIDGATQDFLAGWYNELKAWALIAAEDHVGRSGTKLGERITITDEGLKHLEAQQAAG